MRKFNWGPIDNEMQYPQLMAALQEALDNNYDPEVDKASALDALDVPYDLDEDGKPQINPVSMWPVSAVREIALQTGKSIATLLGEDVPARPKYTDELVEMALNLKDAANALEELSEVVMPNLPIGPRELFDVAETGLYNRIRREATRAENVAKATSGKPETDITLEATFNLSRALGITSDELSSAIEEANVQIVKSNA